MLYSRQGGNAGNGQNNPSIPLMGAGGQQNSSLPDGITQEQLELARELRESYGSSGGSRSRGSRGGRSRGPTNGVNRVPTSPPRRVEAPSTPRGNANPYRPISSPMGRGMIGNHIVDPRVSSTPAPRTQVQRPMPAAPPDDYVPPHLRGPGSQAAPPSAHQQSASEYMPPHLRTSAQHPRVQTSGDQSETPNNQRRNSINRVANTIRHLSPPTSFLSASTPTPAAQPVRDPNTYGEPIVTNWGPDPVGPVIPAHLRQASAYDAICEIAKVTGMALDEVTSDGVSIPAHRPRLSTEQGNLAASIHAPTSAQSPATGRTSAAAHSNGRQQDISSEHFFSQLNLNNRTAAVSVPRPRAVSGSDAMDVDTDGASTSMIGHSGNTFSRPDSSNNGARVATLGDSMWANSSASTSNHNRRTSRTEVDASTAHPFAPPGTVAASGWPYNAQPARVPEGLAFGNALTADYSSAHPATNVPTSGIVRTPGPTTASNGATATATPVSSGWGEHSNVPSTASSSATLGWGTHAQAAVVAQPTPVSGWGAPNAVAPRQAPPANAWGVPAQDSPQQVAPSISWGTPVQAVVTQSSSGWGAPATPQAPAPTHSWGAQAAAPASPAQQQQVVQLSAPSEPSSGKWLKDSRWA